MLVLARGINQSIVIDDDIRITVVGFKPQKDGKVLHVRLGIVAPPSVAVHRLEVWEEMQRGEGEARSLAAAAPAGSLAGSWWYAVRVRDGACCIVWRYVDAAGELRVACARTGRPVSDADFNFLGPVDWPVGAQAIQ